MLVVPTAYQPLKVVLLAAALGGVGGMAAKDGLHLPIHRAVIVLTAIYVLAGVTFVTLGLLNGAPGALRTSTVYILWPIVYTVLVAGAGPRILRRLDGVLVAAAVAICVYSLLYILIQAELLPSWAFVDLHQEQRVGFYNGFMQVHLASLSSLLFLIPYLLASQVLPASTDGKYRILRWIALLLALLVAVLSLRRALIVIVALSPFLTLALLLFLRKPHRADALWRLARAILVLGTVAIIACVLAMSVFGWRPDLWYREVVAGYQFEDPAAAIREVKAHPGSTVEDVPSTQARLGQFAAPIRGWLEHSSAQQPWVYLIVALSSLLTLVLLLFLREPHRADTLRRLVRPILLLGAVAFMAGVLAMSVFGWWPDLRTQAGRQLEDPAAAIQEVKPGTRVEDVPPTQARSSQFAALITGWREHPLLGAGHGAVASVVRSTEQPWAYELTYLALLFHTGLIGLFVYASGVIWIFWVGVRSIGCRGADVAIVPVLAGTASFLIANATNPYLEKFDYIWVIFLPVAFLNVWLLRRPGGRASRSVLRPDAGASVSAGGAFEEEGLTEVDAAT